MIDAIIDTVKVPEGDEKAWVPAAMLRGMLRAYHRIWGVDQQDYQILDIERVVNCDLRNPDTTQKSRTFRLAGKIDKLVKDGTGAIILFDHKTTSSSIAPEAPYWKQLAIDSQPSHYTYMLRMEGDFVSRVVWDVAKKPMIRPRKLTAVEQRLHKAERETAALYEARVAETCLTLPHQYFARRGITRANREMLDYANEIWQIGQEIKDTRRHDRWYKNSGACMTWGRACPYLGLCSHEAKVEDWHTTEQVHPELGEMKDAKTLLTNSRVKTYQLCRRKHYYRYELGLQEEEDDSEALQFGSAWHEALDRYWLAVEETKKDGLAKRDHHKGRYAT